MPLVANAADQRAQIADLVMIESASWLIEQQQLRFRGKSARQLNSFLRSKGKIGDAAMGDVAQI
jgi:hypothetical protein